MRKSWDEYFMDIAFQVRKGYAPTSGWSCGCKDNRIKGTGYNGSPSGMNHCDDAGCLMRNNHCIRTIHAEVNALLECSQKSEKVRLYMLLPVHVPNVRNL